MTELKGQRYILSLLFAVSTFNYIDRTIISILQVPIKKDLNLTDTELGLLTGLSFALFYTTLSLPIARWADRAVRKRIIAGALSVWSLMTALTGLANSFTTLVLLRIGVAAGEAGSIPASHSMIADLYSPKKRATALAVLGISLPVGMMLGFVSAGFLADKLGWRTSFALIGGIGLLIAPFVLWTIREPVRGRFDFVSHDPQERESLFQAIRQLWHIRSYRFLIGGAALHAYGYYSIMNWSAPFYVRAHGLSLSEVSYYLALANGIAGGIGMYLGGWLSDRLGQFDVRLRVRLLAFAQLIFVPLAIGQYMVESTTLSLSIGVAAFAMLPFYYGPVIAIPQMLVTPSMRALTSAVTLLVVNLFGLGLGPALTGLISDMLVSNYGMVQDSLRYAISSAVMVSLIAAIMYWQASKFVTREVLVPPESTMEKSLSTIAATKNA